jgi:hypothetical protein
LAEEAIFSALVVLRADGADCISGFGGLGGVDFLERSFRAQGGGV